MINFVSKKYWFFLISAVLIIPGIIILAIFGLKLGVDFSSGTAMVLHFDPQIQLGQLRQKLAESGFTKAVVQPSSEGDYFIRVREMSAEETNQLIQDLESKIGSKITVSSLFTVSPIVAAGTVRNTIIAIIVASIGILLYIVWAFRRMPKPIRWGTCAVIALIHDVLVVISIFSILSWTLNIEVDALFVTGVLAVIGYSINNIIVVFDRIRENVKRGVSKDFSITVNVGITESIGRSINTGITTLLVITAVLLLGGITIQNLILTLMIGIAIGVYTSLCIAGQLLVVWDSNEIGKLFRKKEMLKNPT